MLLTSIYVLGFLDPIHISNGMDMCTNATHMIC